MNILILKTCDYDKTSFIDFYDKLKLALNLFETSNIYNVTTRNINDLTVSERLIRSDLAIALSPPPKKYTKCVIL